ncbi:MAG: hypothetical protein ACR2GD_12175 [Pyrinomonadaceae bacterium]
MNSESEKDTLPNSEQILIAINGLRADTSSLRSEMNARFEEIRLQMMSFDVRIDRIEALTHEVLNVAYNARADVKVLREEVRAWSKEVSDLQLKAA